MAEGENASDTKDLDDAKQPMAGERQAAVTTSESATSSGVAVNKPEFMDLQDRRIPTEGMSMERFYDNLWNKGMGKLEALREAQLWMLTEGVSCATGHREDTRGVIPVDEQRHAKRRTSPRYWAAFQLSGDWR